ncbi:histidinol-phosphate transaminase [Gryllotalpicola sp.]|uniref:histidinol-phosphate transaminase n=1 Tax=Gryllotalpicola sp. TaxID=1932787 RepID=UPI00260A2ABC|nr:histidinol-phosphate transaminase [Gryllotalpicola sp.]
MTTLDDLPLRDDLRGLKPYGAPQAHLRVELNVNENTHGVPAEVQVDILNRLREAVANANRYPDREFTELREALADFLGHGLTPDQIWAANGSNEIIQQILQAFGGPGRVLFSFEPTYSMYPLYAKGTATNYVGGRREADFTLGPEDAAAQVAAGHPDVVILCSPNNPTGTPLSLDVVKAVYEATRGIVVVDEAYQEFAPKDAPSALSLLPGRERLIVSRTMSKAFAFAGVRLGYLAADPAVADALRLVRLPYHLSALTQAAALGALAHTDLMLQNVDDIKVQRDRIITTLKGLGLTVHASWSNFVLFGGLDDPHGLWNALYEEGIIVRETSIPGHLRVTAGTQDETSEFLSAVARYVRNRAEAANPASVG